MTYGVGGSTADIELSKLSPAEQPPQPISLDEYQVRIHKLCALMQSKGVDAVYLDATTSLRYFTGMQCYMSERLHGALITSYNSLVYICPAFEEQKTKASMLVDGDFLLWDEHESPTEAVAKLALKLSKTSHCRLAIDSQTPFFTASRLQAYGSSLEVTNAEELIAACRQIKTDHELSLLTHAKAITLNVQKAAAAILHEGIDTREVQAFLDQAHRASGMDGASSFKIVLFGEPTAYPHGVPYPQTLKEGDMVLIDTGGTIHGYNSDITRSYVFGQPSPRQRELWDLERAAQLAAFNASQIGAPCSAPDDAARAVIVAAGLGPGYQTPGLAHRTGHGVGLDIHEHPYIVKGNDLPLAPGMCFSIEPMICSYGEFGVRLEDHAFIGENGPEWFTVPSESIENPLNL